MERKGPKSRAINGPMNKAAGVLPDGGKLEPTFLGAHRSVSETLLVATSLLRPTIADFMKCNWIQHRGSRLFCLVFCCFLGGFGSSGLAALEWKQDQITVDAKLTDVVLSCRYEFENKNSGPVHILNVHPSCSCVSGTASKQTIDPGAKGQIDVTFDLEGKVGPQDKKIYVETDDGAPPKLLTLKVNVPQWITFTSEDLTWTKGEFREPKNVDIQFMPGLELSTVSVSSSNEAIKTELKPLERASEYRVVLIPTPDDTRRVKAKVKVQAVLKSGIVKNATFIVTLP